MSTKKTVLSHFTVNYHTSVYVLLRQLASLRHLQSFGAGPACSIPVSSPSSSSVCWQDHLVLLLVARFWIILHNNGLKDCLDQFHSRAARDRSASCSSVTVAVLPTVHTWMHGHRGMIPPTPYPTAIIHPTTHAHTHIHINTHTHSNG